MVTQTKSVPRTALPTIPSEGMSFAQLSFMNAVKDNIEELRTAIVQIQQEVSRLRSGSTSPPSMGFNSLHANAGKGWDITISGTTYPVADRNDYIQFIQEDFMTLARDVANLYAYVRNNG